MWVFKLGGSLAASPVLAQWATLLAGEGAGRVVVVPGGGPFAAAVRRMQRRWNVADAVAHPMALAAMEQLGWLLTGLAAGLRVVDDCDAARRALAEGRVPVWVPARSLAHDPTIPAGWEVTSDSLAAWLAGRLGARRLVLVKSVMLADRSVGAAALAARGIVDAAFPRFAAQSGAHCHLLPRAALERARHALAGGDADALPRILI